MLNYYSGNIPVKKDKEFKHGNHEAGADIAGTRKFADSYKVLIFFYF
jgi:hypothetical protein